MKFEYYVFLFIVSLCLLLNELILASAQKNANNEERKAAIQKVQEMCGKYKEARYKTNIHHGLLLEPPTIEKKLDCIHVETLISKGEKAEPKEFPHMALVGHGSKKEEIEWNCGGSLISDQFVLSAAHCNHGPHGKATWARLGEYNLFSATRPNTKDPHDYKIAEVHEHNKYRPSDSYHDITLYKLATKVTFNAFIRPLCLHTEDAILPNISKAMITGWGATQATDEKTDYLQKATVSIMEDKFCEESYNKNVQKFSNGFNKVIAICAGELVNGTDTCHGDSGGPLQIRIETNAEKCMYWQIGITSIGRLNCGDRTHPAVYTKVSKYVDWIQKIVWP